MAVRAFITYAHASDGHKGAVHDLAVRLRHEGVDAIIDQFEPHPPEGWPKWMELQFQRADKIILVPSEKYLQRYMQDGAEDSGARFEGAMLTTRLLRNGVNFSKIAVAYLDRVDTASIPELLTGCQRYEFQDASGYEGLYRWLTEQRAVLVPPLGAVRALLPISDGNRPESAANASKDGRFRLLCKALNPLLLQNHRIFTEFSPKSGEGDSGRPLRLDFSVWNNQKEKTIAPNNAKMKELITANFAQIPSEFQSSFDLLLSHIDAFDAHVKHGNVDYREHQFPAEINSIISDYS